MSKIMVAVMLAGVVSRLFSGLFRNKGSMAWSVVTGLALLLCSSVALYGLGLVGIGITQGDEALAAAGSGAENVLKGVIDKVRSTDAGDGSGTGTAAQAAPSVIIVNGQDGLESLYDGAVPLSGSPVVVIGGAGDVQGAYAAQEAEAVPLSLDTDAPLTDIPEADEVPLSGVPEVAVMDLSGIPDGYDMQDLVDFSARETASEDGQGLTDIPDGEVPLGDRPAVKANAVYVFSMPEDAQEELTDIPDGDVPMDDRPVIRVDSLSEIPGPYDIRYSGVIYEMPIGPEFEG